MARRDAADVDPDDEEEPEEEDAPRRAPPRRAVHRRHRPPPKAWPRSGEGDDADDAEEGDPDEAPRSRRRWRLPANEREPVFYRARDSVFFEPLVALAIIVLILVGLYAYTQNWPPLYVVESSSMQHGTVDQVGLINTGDLVLAQKVSFGAITPYVVGMTEGYSTYGEYGDVVLYHPNGVSGGTPIIHRAIVYLDANSDGSFNAPALAGLPCGSVPDWVFSANSSIVGDGCATTSMTGTLTIRDIGWRSVYIHVPLSSVGRSSGFVTMGDNNFAGSQGIPDEPALTALVQPGWIVGVARGMLPWFGAVKLLLSSDAQDVPPQSWEYLGLTVVGLIAVAVGLHYLLRAEGIEDPRRKAREEEEDDEEPEEAPSGRHRSWRHPLRGTDDEDEESGERTTPSKRHPKSPPSESVPSSAGRPRPRVGRRSPPKDDDSDEDL
jgi:signal peptidase I